MRRASSELASADKYILPSETTMIRSTQSRPACMPFQTLSACLALALATPAALGATPAALGEAPLRGGHAPLAPLLDAKKGLGLASLARSSSPQAATIPVTNCEDDGSLGSLREAVITASVGDTVDLSALTCGSITLQTGAIPVDLERLTIIGPGANELTIDGNDSDRVFTHSGAGLLTLRGLTIAHGRIAAPAAYGGCIFSTGPLSIYDSRVTGCTAEGETAAAGGGILSFGILNIGGTTIDANTAVSSAGDATDRSAEGGGIVAAQSVVMQTSVVSGNTAHAMVGGAYGGGIVALGTASDALSVKYSTFSGNIASGNSTSLPSGGGGVLSSVPTAIFASTIDHNHADAAAGIYCGAPLEINGSTVSGNVATFAAGGVLAQNAITIANSTIAFNNGGSEGGGGVVFESSAVDLESSILADNTPSGQVGGADLAGSPTVTVTGANNLVKISSVSVPAGTMISDPRLLALADNGGPTRTHALAPTSPAIDQGNTTDAVGAFDQRGAGYPRVVGAAVDIGAYEYSDTIFANGFDPSH
jgi:hypothetical protein